MIIITSLGFDLIMNCMVNVADDDGVERESACVGGIRKKAEVKLKVKPSNLTFVPYLWICSFEHNFSTIFGRIEIVKC